jgi:hypothetical protein
MTRLAAIAFALAMLGAAVVGCKRSRHHTRVASYLPPPVPAGFGEQSGVGWRLAVPSTWREGGKGPAVWAAMDPQTADDMHASGNVVAEPFAGDSYDYARANEAGLRSEPRATVEVAREDVVDGDPTLFIQTRWAPLPPSTVPYKTIQVALASRGAGYIVTCSVSSSAFERYRSTCESILRSFAVER